MGILMSDKEFKKYVRRNYYDRPKVKVYFTIIIFLIIIAIVYFFTTSHIGTEIIPRTGDVLGISNYADVTNAANEIKEGLGDASTLLNDLEAAVGI